MVGRLSLPDAPELPDSKRRAERALDSPDSGLPPSPSPGSWLANGLPEADSGAPPAAKPPPAKTSSSPNPLRLCPLSFGEGVEFDPLPPKDIRYTSLVKYDSEKHFINNIYMPVQLGVSSCSQTVICVPDSTWRSYKAEVKLQLCNRPRNFTSTTIVYPKHTKTVYTTTLDYNCKKFMRKFLSSVELESSGNDNNLDSC
ncbi:refilin-B isoform X2 [Candoia aspera]|uniref:refilin-B isoform X2 n=1 Tax=Candoia aspera TaxID=51853 RepID=UPI002FD80FCC